VAGAGGRGRWQEQKAGAGDPPTLYHPLTQVVLTLANEQDHRSCGFVNFRGSLSSLR